MSSSKQLRRSKSFAAISKRTEENKENQREHPHIHYEKHINEKEVTEIINRLSKSRHSSRKYERKYLIKIIYETEEIKRNVDVNDSGTVSEEDDYDVKPKESAKRKSIKTQRSASVSKESNVTSEESTDTDERSVNSKGKDDKNRYNKKVSSESSEEEMSSSKKVSKKNGDVKPRGSAKTKSIITQRRKTVSKVSDVSSEESTEADDSSVRNKRKDDKKRYYKKSSCELSEEEMSSIKKNSKKGRKTQNSTSSEHSSDSFHKEDYKSEHKNTIKKETQKRTSQSETDYSESDNDVKGKKKSVSVYKKETRLKKPRTEEKDENMKSVGTTSRYSKDISDDSIDEKYFTKKDILQSKRKPSNLVSGNHKGTIKILVIGPSGCGKTTLINSLVNYITYENPSEAKRSGFLAKIPSKFTVFMDDSQIYTAEVSGEHNATGGGYQFKYLRECSFEYDSVEFQVTDTQGFGEKVSHDNGILQEVSDYMADTKIDAIWAVFKSNESRGDTTIKTTITNLQNVAEMFQIRSVYFIFTHCRGTFFRPGDTFSLLNELLQDTAGSDNRIHLEKDNVFCFENEAFRYLVTSRKQNMVYTQSDIVSFGESWKNSTEQGMILLKNMVDDQLYN